MEKSATVTEMTLLVHLVDSVKMNLNVKYLSASSHLVQNLLSEHTHARGLIGPTAPRGPLKSSLTSPLRAEERCCGCFKSRFNRNTGCADDVWHVRFPRGAVRVVNG